MTFHQFLLILRARRKVVIAILLLTVTVTLIVSLLLPKQYTASTAVVIDVKSPDPVAGMVHSWPCFSRLYGYAGRYHQ